VCVSSPLRLVSVVVIPSFCSYGHCAHLDLHSFPTRRSSDLTGCTAGRAWSVKTTRPIGVDASKPTHSAGDSTCSPAESSLMPPGDRKSTRLNSSHVKISYAVFCLKKKKNEPIKIAAESYVQS